MSVRSSPHTNLLQLPLPIRVYLHREPVDGRKQIGMLAVIVQEAMGHSPFEPSVFGFISRSRRVVKLLYWAENGFCLWQKRLSKHRFPWPGVESGAVVVLSEHELEWLLRGIDYFRLKPHERLRFGAVG